MGPASSIRATLVIVAAVAVLFGLGYGPALASTWIMSGWTDR